MVLFKKAADLRNYLDAKRKNGMSIGFVPTMGALHAGHLSLIAASKKETGLTVCSIFINPTQFNDPVDFQKYPVTTEEDILSLTQQQCDVLFIPDAGEIYPDEMSMKQRYPLGRLEEVLEGKFRPGHFQGVCMVVHRLLDIVQPDILYLGQKDYQQCKVIASLLELTGFDKSVSIKICPTLREPDGLAMSSRNRRLNEKERKKAAAIFRALQYIRENINREPLSQLKETAARMLEEKGFRVDYISIADAAALEETDVLLPDKKMVALAAAYLGQVRLIDNLILE